MTAIALSHDERIEALRLAREIGAAIRSARRARGESAEAAAAKYAWHYSTLVGVERGRENVKLGTLVRLLGQYGLTLRIARRSAAVDLYHAEKARRDARVASNA